MVEIEIFKTVTLQEKHDTGRSKHDEYLNDDKHGNLSRMHSLK
jgi:hypothetical protein